MKDSGEDAKKIGIMVASHNEDTVRFAIEKMKEIGISPEDKVICFGQLLGMCDYITFPLGMSLQFSKFANSIEFNCPPNCRASWILRLQVHPLWSSPWSPSIFVATRSREQGCPAEDQEREASASLWNFAADLHWQDVLQTKGRLHSHISGRCV